MSSYAALYLKRRGYDDQGTGDEEDVEAVATPATVDVFYPTPLSPAPRSRMSISVQHSPHRPQLPHPPSRRPPAQMPPRVDQSTLETRSLPGPRVRVDPVHDTSHPRAVITMRSALSTPMRQPARVACNGRRVQAGVSGRGDSRAVAERIPPRMGGAVDRSIVGEVSVATRRSTSSMVSRLIAESVRKMQQKRWMHTGAAAEDDAAGDIEGRRPARGREGRSSALPLSSALGESVQQVFDGQRLRVGGKGITRIDRVPERMAGAVVALYMGDNDLRDVAGILQFANVRTLSLANNLLRRLADLEPLKELRFLESLVLEGNPVVREAGYRLHVIGTLSNTLKMLDGIAVTEVERKEAPGAVRRVRAFYHEGFKNTCRILQLEHVTKLLAVHEELREVLYGSRRNVPSGSLSSLLRGTEGRNPAQVVDRMLDLWPFESWAWAYPHLRDLVEEELRRESADAMESGRGTCWELCLGQVLLQQQEALSVLAERAEALIKGARAWAGEQSAAYAGPVRSPGPQTAAIARKPKNPQTPSASAEMKLQASLTTAGHQPQPTANAALTDRHTIHRRYTTLLRQRHGGPKVIRPRKQPGCTTQAPAAAHSLFHDADVSAILMHDTSELSVDSIPLVVPAAPMVPSPPHSPGEHTSPPRRTPRMFVPRKPPAVADTSTRRVMFSARAASGGRVLQPPLPPPPEAPPPPAQGPRPPDSFSAASAPPRRGMQRAMSGVGGGFAPESLTPSLPPQQREPEEVEEGEGPREILPVALVRNMSDGETLEAASRESQALPVDIQDIAPLFKSTMDGRLPPPARPMGVCRTVKGLQEQVGAMQKDLVSRVKVQFSLYNMNRALRKRLSETRKRRLDEMDMADRHATMAGAELERLREGIKSLTLRVEEVERSEREAVELEAGLEEVSQLADAEAESARRAEQHMVRATEERRRLIQQLERASAELTNLRSEFCTHEALARAEHALRSYERADEFRRQRLRLHRHRSLTLRSVIMLFKEFCGRLRYSRQLRLKLSRVDRVRSAVKALMIFRRWRRAILRDRACRSCMARYRHRVLRYVFGAWWKRWLLCGAVRNLAQRRLTPLVVVAFKRLRSSANTRRTRREIVQLIRHRRVARRCLTAWQTHVGKLRYRDPELRLADARALGLRQRILWRRWLRFIRCEASAAERVRRVVETRLRPFTLSRTFARWRYQASVKQMQRPPRGSTQLIMPREANARRVRAVKLLLLVLQRCESSLLKEALSRWAAWVWWCDQRYAILPRLAKAFERRAMRNCMKVWRAGIRYRLRQEQLLHRAWRRQARSVAKRIVREWARAARMSKRLRRGLEILHHVVRRHLLRRGRRRWAAIMGATPRGHDEVDVWREAKLRAMRRRSAKVWMAALFMRWMACARRRRRAQRAVVTTELLQRTWRMRRVFTAWMLSHVESALAMVVQRRADAVQQQRWHLSLSQSLCEEDERITAAECQVVALQGHLKQMAAELVYRQTELLEAGSQTEREQARTEGLRFRVEMLKDEIEAKKQEIQDVRADAEGDDSCSAAVSAAGIDGADGKLTLQDGQSNPSPEELPFMMEEMTQKERALQQRIESVMAEEAWLQQALHEREVTKGPTAAMVQDQISMARQFRAEFDHCCIEAEALEHEKREMQERLHACMRALDKAQADLAARRRSCTVANFTKESAVLEKQLKTARKKFDGQVDRRRSQRDVGQSTSLALRAADGRRAASSPPHREEHLVLSCPSDSEPIQPPQTMASALPGTLTPPAPTRKVEVPSPTDSSQLRASSATLFADRGEDLSLRAELEEARALNAYLEASLRGSRPQQVTFPAATIQGSPERSYTREMQQVEGLESEIAADILKLQRRVEERFAASRRRPA